MFPYSVVEVKLRGPHIANPPLWLRDLESKSQLRKENRLSKYIHAAYGFDRLYGGPMKLSRPAWWDVMQFVYPQIMVSLPI
jgi:SPX domain protein involved in polyphosphate accumulation